MRKTNLIRKTFKMKCNVFNIKQTFIHFIINILYNYFKKV